MGGNLERNRWLIVDDADLKARDRRAVRRGRSAVPRRQRRDPSRRPQPEGDRVGRVPRRPPRRGAGTGDRLATGSAAARAVACRAARPGTTARFFPACGASSWRHGPGASVRRGPRSTSNTKRRSPSCSGIPDVGHPGVPARRRLLHRRHVQPAPRRPARRGHLPQPLETPRHLTVHLARFVRRPNEPVRPTAKRTGSFRPRPQMDGRGGRRWGSRRRRGRCRAWTSRCAGPVHGIGRGDGDVRHGEMSSSSRGGRSPDRGSSAGYSAPAPPATMGIGPLRNAPWNARPARGTTPRWTGLAIAPIDSTKVMSTPVTAAPIHVPTPMATTATIATAAV